MLRKIYCIFSHTCKGKQIFLVLQDVVHHAVTAQMGNKNDQPKKIILKDIHKTYYVKIDEIMYCEADGIYTKFVLTNQQNILVSKNLKEYESLLEPLGFVRTHHSFLVNPDKIRVFDKSEGGMLILEDGTSIPVSQRKKETVLKNLEL